MPLPWLQIVQLMPAILDVSRELLKRTRHPSKAPGASLPVHGNGNVDVLEARIMALEENERRQAELVSNMAEQLAQLTAAATVLHRQVKRLIVGQVAASVIALVALLVAVTR
jgi:uncharacterized coiled-coil protein SlyX